MTETPPHAVTNFQFSLGTALVEPRRQFAQRFLEVFAEFLMGGVDDLSTEHGAIMAATVLNSRQAVEMSVYVVRAFVRLREMIASNKELAAKLNELERKLATHDQAITGLIKTIRQLMAPPPEPKKRPIGFVPPEEK